MSIGPVEQRRDSVGNARSRPRKSLTASLLPAMERLQDALERKRTSFTTSSRSAGRICRTPCRCGWARSSAAMRRRSRRAIERIDAALLGIYELPLGGTAVGTGLNAPPGFAAADDRSDCASAPGCRFAKRAITSKRRRRKTQCIPQRGAAQLRHRSDEDRQRYPLAGVGAPRRARRTQASGIAARIEHHARQGESGDRGEPADGLRAGDRHDATIAWCGAAGNFLN